MATTAEVESWVGDRYWVVAPKIWLDTKPARLPTAIAPLPDTAFPYLKLLPQRLHLPELYDVYDESHASQVDTQGEEGDEFVDEANESEGPRSQDPNAPQETEPEDGDRSLETDESQETPTFLLSNVPIDAAGHLLASLAAAWPTASPTRQSYWLWQLLQLWIPLMNQGVTRSLFVMDNLRVEGWRVRLLELFPDKDPETPEMQAPTLKDLAQFWEPLVDHANPAITQPLRELCQQMMAIDRPLSAYVELSPELADMEPQWPSEQHPPEFPQFQAIAHRLNRLLLEQASQLPLKLSISGGTSTGPRRSHNEDSCFPDTLEEAEQNQPDDVLLMPRFALVCDGIGGHAGGEVASQLAVRSLKLQICALLTEVAEQAELLPPEVVSDQMEAIIRVVNNLISSQNDTQGRESRQRMGTTVVMALQLPQQVISPAGANNTHELYLAHVGDSRAYWLTQRYCHCLTVDDELANREVRMTRSLRRQASQRSDGGALTQAVGTREGSLLRPTVQRFILEEDGILLLCSDGLSDRQQVEASWEQTTRQVLRDTITLDEAVQAWIDLANHKNGHDNTSVVMLRCQVSPSEPHLFDPANEIIREDPDAELSESSRALLYGEEPDISEEIEASETPEDRMSVAGVWAIALGCSVLFFVLGGVLIFVLQRYAPDTFRQILEPLLPSSEVNESLPTPDEPLPEETPPSP